jgi:hypothetical protein
VNCTGLEVVAVPFDGRVTVGGVDDVVIIGASVVRSVVVGLEEVVSEVVIGSAGLVVAVALGVSAGGGMTLKLIVAPQSARGVPFGQQPALVQ